MGACCWRLFNLVKWRLRGDLINFRNSLKGGCGRLGFGLFPQATSDSTREHSPKLHQSRLRWDVRRDLFTD